VLPAISSMSSDIDLSVAHASMLGTLIGIDHVVTGSVSRCNYEYEPVDARANGAGELLCG